MWNAPTLPHPPGDVSQCFNLLLFSCSVISNSLQPNGLQHIRLPCPSPSPRVCSKSCTLSQMLMPSNHFILCHPLLLLSSTFPSIRIFSNESVLRIRWPNYRSFRFSISTSGGYSGLISFRADWFDLLAVQGTPKSLLQHHNFYFIQMSSDIVNLLLSSVWPLRS